METYCVALLWEQFNDDYYVLLIRDGGSIYDPISMIYGRDGYIRSAWSLTGLDVLFVLRNLDLGSARHMMQDWVSGVEWTFDGLLARGYSISFEEQCDVSVSNIIQDSYDLVADVYSFLSEPTVE